MKKTNKIIMGVTALVMAFSACALTACGSSQPDDGSIKGNYQEATAEQVSETLNTVNQEQLFGDTSAEDYKFGIELTSNLDLTITSAGDTNAVKLNAGYAMLVTGSESAFSYKGAGTFNVNTESTPAEGEKSTGEIALNLWQNDFMTYASMTATSSEDKEDTEPTAAKIKFNVSELVSSLIPSEGGDSVIPNLPEGVELPGSITTPDVSSLDLVAAVKALNEMGATIAMDTTNGIKLKVTLTQDVIYNAIAEMMDATAEQAAELISFTTCSLDFYLSIDKNGMFEATSIVADIEATSNFTDEATAASTIKLEGYMSFKVNADVNPEVPESLKTDLTYLDVTAMLPGIIGGIIGGGSMIG